MRDKKEIANAVARYQQKRETASADAVFCSPSLIEGFKGHNQQSVFSKALEQHGDDPSKLFLIAKCSGKSAYFCQLVDYVMGRRDSPGMVDRLWAAIVRLAIRWSESDHSPEWDDEAAVRNAMSRLSICVTQPVIEEVLVMMNPAFELWFAGMADFDRIWETGVRRDLDAGDWNEGFNKLIIAGLGMPWVDSGIIQSKLELLPDQFRRIQDAKQFNADDKFGWQIYGRCSNFGDLVDMAYHAHAKAGLLDPDHSLPDLRKSPNLYVNSTKAHQRGMLTSVYGLISRDPKSTRLVSVEFDGQKRAYPTRTIPGETGEKLLRLIVCHRERASQGGRQNVNVRGMFQA